MAKKIGRLARRYGRALYAAVEKELGTTGSPTPAQKISSELREFVEIWNQDKELSFCLLSPMFEREKRIAALGEIGKKAGLASVSLRFLQTLAERDRLGALPEVVASFSDVADEAAGAVKVEVVTAAQLNAEELSEIERSLRQCIKGQPEFTWHVDKALLGGIIVRFGGKVLDGSVSGRLERLERALMA